MIAATGFKAHRDRLGLLSAELRGAMAALPDGSPVLDRGFESSYPGLFLAGLVTASGFGPAMRFVHGATFTASTLVQGAQAAAGGPGARVCAGARGSGPWRHAGSGARLTDRTTRRPRTGWSGDVSRRGADAGWGGPGVRGGVSGGRRRGRGGTAGRRR